MRSSTRSSRKTPRRCTTPQSGRVSSSTRSDSSSFPHIIADTAQGYAFKVITELHGLDTLPDLVFPTKASQISLLEEVLNTGDNAWETQDHYMRLNNGKHQRRPTGAQSASVNGPGTVPAAQRFMAPLEHLSGGQNLSYKEQNKSIK